MMLPLLTGLPSNFWATVCKTVRPMLSVCCPVCLSVCLSVLSVLSVTLVYCGQTVGRMKMKLGIQVGLGPGHIVLGGDRAAPPLGAQPPPNFRPISVAAKWLHGSRCHLVWSRARPRPRRHCVRWGPRSPPQLAEIVSQISCILDSTCNKNFDGEFGQL